MGRGVCSLIVMMGLKVKEQKALSSRFGSVTQLHGLTFLISIRAVGLSDGDDVGFVHMSHTQDQVIRGVETVSFEDKLNTD